MSTEYDILHREGAAVITLLEHSSLLDIEIARPNTTRDLGGGVEAARLSDLTADEAVRAALQILRVASYQYEEHEFQNVVRAVVLDEKSTYLREVIVAAYDALPRLD